VRWRIRNSEGGHDEVATGGREESNGDAPSQMRNSTRTTGTGARLDKKEKGRGKSKRLIGECAGDGKIEERIKS